MEFLVAARGLGSDAIGSARTRLQTILVFANLETDIHLQAGSSPSGVNFFLKSTSTQSAYSENARESRMTDSSADRRVESGSGSCSRCLPLGGCEKDGRGVSSEIAFTLRVVGGFFATLRGIKAKEDMEIAERPESGIYFHAKPSWLP